MSAQGDCEFLVKRARELVPGDLWAAKAWLITARSLYPADFNIQVSASAPALYESAALPHTALRRALRDWRARRPMGWGGGASRCRGDGGTAFPLIGCRSRPALWWQLLGSFRAPLRLMAFEVDCVSVLHLSGNLSQGSRWLFSLCSNEAVR